VARVTDTKAYGALRGTFDAIPRDKKIRKKNARHVHKRFSNIVSVARKSMSSDSFVPAPWKSVTACRFSIQIFSTFLPSPDHSETSFGTLSSCPNRSRNPFVDWAHLIFGRFSMPPATTSINSAFDTLDL
jgi:hypothetical protein